MFERMVGSTKKCLRKMIGQARLSFDEMNTAIVEVEMTLNSRPISYVSMEDPEEPLILWLDVVCLICLIKFATMTSIKITVLRSLKK